MITLDSKRDLPLEKNILIFLLAQAFKYCELKNEDDCINFKKSYHSNGKVVMDNHPLMIMANEEQKNLLRHPLCMSLVRRKWMKYGRYIYYSGLMSYLVFLAFLTSFALLSPNIAIQSNLNSSCETVYNEWVKTKDLKEKSFWLLVSQVGILALSSVQLLLEVIQFFRVLIFSYFLE